MKYRHGQSFVQTFTGTEQARKNATKGDGADGGKACKHRPRKEGDGGSEELLHTQSVPLGWTNRRDERGSLSFSQQQLFQNVNMNNKHLSLLECTCTYNTNIYDIILRILNDVFTLLEPISNIYTCQSTCDFCSAGI